jgi:hypothetical protein
VPCVRADAAAIVAPSRGGDSVAGAGGEEDPQNGSPTVRAFRRAGVRIDGDSRASVRNDDSFDRDATRDEVTSDHAGAAPGKPHGVFVSTSLARELLDGDENVGSPSQDGRRLVEDPQRLGSHGSEPGLERHRSQRDEFLVRLDHRGKRRIGPGNPLAPPR